MFKQIGKKVLKLLGDYRQVEYKHTLPMLVGCEYILDAGCGTGTFLEMCGKRAVGIDVNPDNVSYCKERGLDTRIGSVLEMPFDDEVFDGVHCSHVMQVLSPHDAVKMIKELGRVTKRKGVVIISTLNWFPRFYRHPENVRPYPPDAIMRYFAVAEGACSPMYNGMPQLSKESIWLRRPPLIEFYSSTNKNIDGVSSILNMMQYRLAIRKFWTYNSYIIKLRKE